MSRDEVSPRWSQWRAQTDLEEYYTRWRRLEVTGQTPHGEADFIESFHPASVLDAGCGMGRVTIELVRRGIAVVGVDLDDDLLDYARRSQSGVPWVHADLATMQLDRQFEVVAMPGNVMVFCEAHDRPAIIATAVDHLVPGGLLIAGFDVEAEPGLTLGEYDNLCAACDLELVGRSATWQGDPYDGGGYAVSVHRRSRGDTTDSSD